MKYNKVAILLTSRYIQEYEFSALPEDLYLVLIDNEEDIKSVNDEVKQSLHEIHIVKRKRRPYGDQYDLKDLSAIIEKYVQHFGKQYTSIICENENSIINSGLLRDKFDISGLSYEASLLFRNKIVMKEYLKLHNINMSAFQVHEHGNTDKDYYQYLVDTHGSPFIMKPAMAHGGLDVVLIHHYDDFIAYNKKLLSGEKYLIETYLHGNLFQCDTLQTEQGDIIFQTCAELYYPVGCLANNQPGLFITLDHKHPYHKKIVEFNKMVLKKLGHFSGCTHLEILINNQGEIAFIEIAARCPGLNVIKAYEKQFKLNVRTTNLLLQVYKNVDIEQKNHTYCFGGMFPMVKGKIKAINPPKLESQFDLDLRITENAYMDNHSKAIFNPAAVIMAWNNNYEVLRSDFDRLKNHKFLEVN